MNLYSTIALFFLVSLGILLGILTLAKALCQRKGSASQRKTYEGGFSPLRAPLKGLNNSFNIYGILFIIFNVDLIFFFPWAVTFKEIGVRGFFYMLFLFFLLGIGFFYAWKKGALEWE